MDEYRKVLRNTDLKGLARYVYDEQCKEVGPDHRGGCIAMILDALRAATKHEQERIKSAVYADADDLEEWGPDYAHHVREAIDAAIRAGEGEG